MVLSQTINVSLSKSEIISNPINTSITNIDVIVWANRYPEIGDHLKTLVKPAMSF